MQAHPGAAVPLVLTWFSYSVQYVKHTYEGNTWTTTPRKKNSICASTVRYPAVTKTSSGLKTAEEQILAKDGRETTLWCPCLLFLIPRPGESDCCFWLSVWCRHVWRCSPCPKEVFFISKQRVELIYEISARSKIQVLSQLMSDTHCHTPRGHYWAAALQEYWCIIVIFHFAGRVFLLPTYLKWKKQQKRKRSRTRNKCSIKAIQ